MVKWVLHTAVDAERERGRVRDNTIYHERDVRMESEERYTDI